MTHGRDLRLTRDHMPMIRAGGPFVPATLRATDIDYFTAEDTIMAAPVEDAYAGVGIISALSAENLTESSTAAGCSPPCSRHRLLFPAFILATA
jgi:hypothetical protein